MNEVKIGVSGNADAARAAVAVMTDAVNDLARSVAAANKIQYQDPGFGKAAKDLGKLERQFQAAIRQSAALRNAIKNSGQSADTGILNIDWNRLSLDPKVSQRMRDRAFAYAARGTAWDQTNVPNRSAPPGTPASGGTVAGAGVGGRSLKSSINDDHAPASRLGSRTAGAFAGGVGGGVSQIANEAISGASAGAEVGGLLGGVGGLAAGAGMGAFLFGVAKIGQLGAEGYELAKQRDLDLDTLKRQMGDLGVSFDRLKDTSEDMSASLGVNALQFAGLEGQQLHASHGAERGPDDAASKVRDSVGFARAYGLDPSQAVSFFGGIRAIDPKQNNRELALLIAEASNRVRGRALPADVMQALEGLAAAASRMSLSTPNLGAMSSSYASLVGQGASADNAGSLLSTANSAITSMGSGAGEAGMNFMLAAMNGEGGEKLNPVAARALAAGGMFGSRLSVFGSGPLASFFKGDASYAALSKGAGGQTMTFDAVRDQLRSSYGGNKWMELDAAQRVFNVSSPQQAAALMQLDDRGYGSLERALDAAGLKLDDVNASGLATLAGVGGARSMDQLRGIYSDVRGRVGPGALSDEERGRLDSLASGGNMEAFRRALIESVADKDQSDTEGSNLRRGTSALESIQVNIGEKMVPMMNDARNALLKLADSIVGGASPSEQDASSSYDPASPLTNYDPRDGWKFKLGYKGGNFADIAATEKKWKLPAGVLKGIWGAESTFGTNTGRNAMGAEGDFQMMDGTAAQYGVKRGDFSSEVDGAGHYLSDLLRKHNGDLPAALFEYNGVKNNINAGDAYLSKVSRYGDLSVGNYDHGIRIENDDSFGPSIPASRSGKTHADMVGTIEHPAQYIERSSATDTVVLDISINALQSNGAGGATSSRVATSVSVPRGSGTQRLSIGN